MAVLRYWDVASSSYISLSGIGPQGPVGPTGPQGAQGNPGPTGPGVPVGGSTGQLLIKSSATNFDAAWGPLPASDPTAVNVQNLLNKADMWVRAVGAAQVMPQGAYTKVNCNTVQGAGTLGNAQYNPATATFTVSQAGRYHVAAHVDCVSQPAACQYFLRTYKNGAASIALVGNAPAVGQATVIALSIILEGLVGDTIDVRFYNNVASGITTNPNNQLFIQQIA